MTRDICVQIIGSGHSGSTLLDMMLGGHSAVSSLGETPFVRWNTNNHTESDVCTCGKRLLDCPFWSKVDLALREMMDTGDEPALPQLRVADDRVASLRDEKGRFVNDERKAFPFRSRLNDLTLVLGAGPIRALAGKLDSEVAMHREIGRSLGLLYQAVRKAHDTPIVIDSSKNPGSFKNAYMESGERDMRMILLVRDGRAVTASRMRRDGYPMIDCATVWRNEHLKRMAASATARSAPQKIVHYEDLATDPKAVVEDLCDWLGISFEEGMLDFRADRHNVGGNPMRHRKSETEIKLDDRWRSELTPEDLATFDDIGGRMNERLGYRD